MRAATLVMSVALGSIAGVAFAEDHSDPLAQVRACSLMERAARLECMDKVSRSITPFPPASGDWTISETMSPVDYTPLVVAVARSIDRNDITQLKIYCRSGRTELVVAGSAVVERADGYALTYRINGNEPVQAEAGAPSFGAGAAYKGDAVRLLQSFPESGDLVVRLVPRTGPVQEGHFFLGGLNLVRDKLASACKWPKAVAKPRN